jgi:hypothetical protein
LGLYRQIHGCAGIRTKEMRKGCHKKITNERGRRRLSRFLMKWANNHINLYE